MLSCSLAFCVSLATAAPAFQGRAPEADPTALLEACFAADGYTPKGRAEQRRIVAELESHPPLSGKDARKWAKTALALAAKGRKLEKKSGQRYFWEEEERGLYVLGGETKKPEALLLVMHGGGAGEGDAWSSHGAYNGAASQLDWLALYPQVLEKTEHGWTDSGTEEFVLQLVDAALRTWKIDRNRVFFSGHSMGGYGTWTLGARHADRVAGLAASAGAPTPIFNAAKEVIDIDKGLIPCLRNVPFVIYQSDDDPRVPPDANRFAAKLLGEARERWGGYPFEYWEEKGRAHELPPGGVEALLARIEARERDPRPARVVWQPSVDWVRQFYWLYWEKPRKHALVVADCDRAKNEVSVTCEGDPAGLEVLLDERLLDLEKEVVVRLAGAEVFRGKPARTLATVVKTALRGDPELVFAARVPLVP